MKRILLGVVIVLLVLGANTSQSLACDIDAAKKARVYEEGVADKILSKCTNNDHLEVKALFRIAYNYQEIGYHEEAIRYYKKSIEIGKTFNGAFWSAAYNLGIIFSGNSKYKDLSLATHWYCEAATLAIKGNHSDHDPVKKCEEHLPTADAVAQYKFGDSIRSYNIAVAATWICSSAQKGFSDGLNECVQMAKSGNSVAQYALGRLYERGEGLLQDFEAAYVWLNIAASNGFNGASDRRNIVGQALNSNQRQRASEWSKRCKESNYQDCEKEPMSWLDKIRKKL